jgi:hypothetical protein
MIQNVITETVCIDCGANVLPDPHEDGAFFDTARGTDYDNAGNTGFDCPARFVNAFMPHRISIPVED